MYYSTTKKLGSKNKKKSLPRAQPGPRQRESLLRAWPMALGKENLKKNKKSLPRAQPGPRQRGSLPRAWPMALGKENLKKNLCRVPDGGHSAKTDASGRRDPSGHICRRFILPRAGKGLFVEGLSLPRAPGSGPRQMEPLSSARDLALGKPRNPQQRMGFQQ